MIVTNKFLSAKMPTSNEIGLVSSVINGDSVDDVVDKDEIVLVCEGILIESDRFSMICERSTFAGAVFTRCERSFDGEDDAKTKLRDVSVPERTTCALRQ